MSTLSVELLLKAYKQGVFPMSDRKGEIDWYCPNPRAIIPIETYKPSKLTSAHLQSGRYSPAVADVVQAWRRGWAIAPAVL